jgi:N-acyl-phosphatidylethanolamine-hydrolysing phospholipase D
VGSEPLPGQPGHHVEGGFRNTDPAVQRASGGARFKFMWSRAWAAARPSDVPRMANDGAALRANATSPTVTWIGHATVLVQLQGSNLLTDPHWGDRASPLSWAGPKRLQPPGMAFEDLPPVHVVLISHDHYDHLDEPTVRRLSELFDPTFVVPWGIKAWLADRGITNAVELGWGQSISLKGLTIVCTPAQHGSGRTMVDQGRRLWASWAVLGSQRFYFAGDTGYYSHFKDIGDALGPFDLAALPIGSYTPRKIARPVHISPEEALQAWTDLRAKRFIGIHWGTFMLAREPYDEPPRRIAAEVSRRELDPGAIWISRPGETLAW